MSERKRSLGRGRALTALLPYGAVAVVLLVSAALIDTAQAGAMAGSRTPLSNPAVARSKAADLATKTAVPSVKKISPTSGPSTGSTVVTIKGTNFTATSKVDFGSTASIKVSFMSSKELKATSPSEAPETVDVRVLNGQQESPVVTKDEFTFTPPACTDSWNGSANSLWSDAANWNKGKIPGKKDVACIPTGKPQLPVQLTTSVSVTTLTNSGGLQISGSLTIKAANSSSSGDLTIVNAGTFSGPGTLTVTGIFTVTGGTLASGQLVNQGAGTLDSSDTLMVASGATFTNSGTLTMDDGSDIDGNECGGAGVFDNTGTLDVDPGSSQVAYIGEYDCGLTVDNSATIELTSGTLDNNDQSNYGNTINLNTGSSITGSGTFEDTGSLTANAASSASDLTIVNAGTFSGPGTLTVTGIFTVTGGTLASGQLVNQGAGTLDSSDTLMVASGATFTNSGTLTMDDGSDIDGNECGGAGVFDNTGTLDVDPGSSQVAYIGEYDCGLTVDNSATIELTSGTLDNNDQSNYGNTINLNTGSSITGSGTFEDTGSLTANAASSASDLTIVNAGTFSGPGTLTVTGIFTVTGGTLASGQLVNQGAGTLDSSDTLMVASGATFTNSGTLTMDDGSDIDGNECGGAGVFDNTGTLDVDPGSSQVAYIGEYDCGLTVDNSATIELTSGTLDNNDQSNYGNTINLNTGSSITGSGTFEDTGSLTANAASSASDLTIVNAGTFSGPGTLTVTGIFTVTGGTLASGQLVNQGAGTLDSSDTLMVASGATFTNSGTLTMDDGSDIDGNECGGAGVFDNTGTLDVDPGSSQVAYIGEYDCGLTVDNSATIELTSGTLDNNDQSNYGNTINLNTGSSITGSGTFEDTGSLTANATVSMPTLTMAGGLLELAAQVDVDATSFGGTSGTVQLDAGSASQFGQLVVTKTAKPIDLSLNLNPSFTPSCGESVMAIQANKVSGPFESVTGPTPSGGTWEATSTSTSAGAVVDC